MVTVRRLPNSDLEIDGDGFQIVRRRRRYHQPSRSSIPIQIEAKSFEMRVLSDPLG